MIRSSFIVCVFLFVRSASSATTSPVVIEETPYDVLDTGVEQSAQRSFGPTGWWVADNVIVFNAVAQGTGGKSEERVARYDTRSRIADTVISEGRIRCFNPETRIAAISVAGKDEHIRINESGDIVRQLKTSDYNPSACRKTLSASEGRDKTLLREGDGYIDRGNVGRVDLNPDFAVLYRPGQPPRDLGVLGREIERPEYLPFLQSYLLNYSDSRRSYHGDRPFRLMKPEGDISEIPYPSRLANSLNNYFNRVIVLRPGLLVAQTGPGPGEAGFFLVQGDRVTRIWGKDKDFVMSYAPAPDGCKFAFMSFAKRAFGETPKTVKVIDACKGSKK